MPRPASWQRFVRWQANATSLGRSPTEALPATLTPVGWYDELRGAGKADSMWTIWHIAFTRAHRLGTIATAFSKALSEPHGVAESEHGSEPGRPALLLLDVTRPLNGTQPRDPPAAAATGAEAPAGEAGHHGVATEHGASLHESATNVLRLAAADVRAAPSTSPQLQPKLARAQDLLADCAEVSGCCAATSLRLVGYDGRAVDWPLADDEL